MQPETAKTTSAAKWRFMGALSALLCGVGCLGSNWDSSWPKPSAASHIRNFDGLFAQPSIDPKGRIPSDHGLELFDFVTNRGHEHDEQGAEVELRASEDGSVLHVRLLDQRAVEVDRADLRRTVDFEFTQGHLDIKGPFIGWHKEASNLAAYSEKRTSQLFLAETGALLGRRTSSGAGLLFYFIPLGGKSVEWMLWPTLPSKMEE